MGAAGPSAADPDYRVRRLARQAELRDVEPEKEEFDSTREYNQARLRYWRARGWDLPSVPAMKENTDCHASKRDCYVHRASK